MKTEKKKWVYVPDKHDWVNIRVRDCAECVLPDADLSYCLICDESDYERLNAFQNFIEDVRSLVKNNYLHSLCMRGNRTPSDSEVVYWLSTSRHDQVLYPIVLSDKYSAIQNYSLYNCYLKKKEVENLKRKIIHLIKAYGF